MNKKIILIHLLCCLSVVAMDQNKNKNENERVPSLLTLCNDAVAAGIDSGRLDPSKVKKALPKDCLETLIADRTGITNKFGAACLAWQHRFNSPLTKRTHAFTVLPNPPKATHGDLSAEVRTNNEVWVTYKDGDPIKLPMLAESVYISSNHLLFTPQAFTPQDTGSKVSCWLPNGVLLYVFSSNVPLSHISL